MKIFSSLFGLLLVAVMACTGIGQEPVYTDAIEKCDLADAALGEYNGACASAETRRDNATSLIADCEAALTGPHFDASYNPDGPAQKAVFQGYLADLAAELVIQKYAYTTSKTSFTTSYTARLANPDCRETSVARAEIERLYSWYGYWAWNVLSGLIQEQRAFAVSNKDYFNGWATIRTAQATVFLAVRDSLQELLTDINAY